MAGAWAGAAKLMRIYASGTNLGFPDVVLEPLNLRPVLRTYESTAFLLPSQHFWSAEEVGRTLIGVSTQWHCRGFINPLNPVPPVTGCDRRWPLFHF